VTLVIIIVAVVLVAVIGVIAYVRRPRPDAGLTSFRRHIDALSPESRREMQDRVRSIRDDDDADGDDEQRQERAD
jgi:uncharacterized membrane protein